MGNTLSEKFYSYHFVKIAHSTITNTITVHSQLLNMCYHSYTPSGKRI